MLLFKYHRDPVILSFKPHVQSERDLQDILRDTPERLHRPPGGSTSEVSYFLRPAFKVATVESA